jgi:hypothetical protein
VVAVARTSTELYVIVDVDAVSFPVAILVTFRGQGAQRWLVERLEQTAARPVPFAEGPVVEACQQFLNGLVDLAQTEESSLSEGCQNPPLDHQYTGFHLRLVARFRPPRRHYRHTVVRGHFLVGSIHARLIATSFGDTRLQIVGDDDLGQAFQKLEGAHVGADPIGQALRRRRLGVGVVAGS